MFLMFLCRDYCDCDNRMHVGSAIWWTAWNQCVLL